MLACQLAMPFGTRKFQKPLERRSRRPFTTPAQTGPYRLPHAIEEQLEKALADFRNAEAAYALAVFLGRFWSSPNRLDAPFPIDRRALAHHRDLQLTEAQIRGAIRTLERVCFLERAAIGRGSRFQRKGNELHRKPISFQFGAEFRDLFAKANKRTKAANPARRAIPSRVPAFSANSPKNRLPSKTSMFMGDLTKKASEKPAAPIAPNQRLEAALARLEHAVREKAT